MNTGMKEMYVANLACKAIIASFTMTLLIEQPKMFWCVMYSTCYAARLAQKDRPSHAWTKRWIPVVKWNASSARTSIWRLWTGRARSKNTHPRTFVQFSTDDNRTILEVIVVSVDFKSSDGRFALWILTIEGSGPGQYNGQFLCA